MKELTLQQTIYKLGLEMGGKNTLDILEKIDMPVSSFYKLDDGRRNLSYVELMDIIDKLELHREQIDELVDVWLKTNKQYNLLSIELNTLSERAIYELRNTFMKELRLRF